VSPLAYGSVLFSAAPARAMAVRSAALSTRATTRAQGLPAESVDPVVEPLDTAAAFKRYAPYVAKIGIRMLGRRDELDDFVQDVFLSVHRHLSTVREPAALKGWLAKIAVREAMARLRRRKLRHLLGLGGAHDYEAVADAAASPEQRAQLARVFEALDALSASERVVWSLRHVEGETLERVAELCGVSLSTAKRRLASAEAALEKKGVGRV
jgi:RNA polymerase sigma-70 factor, ECF subfamily